MSAHLMQAPPPPIEIIPGVPLDLNDIILWRLPRNPRSGSSRLRRFMERWRRWAWESSAKAQAEVVTHTMLPIPVALPAFPTAPPAFNGNDEYLPPARWPAQSPAAPPPAVQNAPSRRGLYMALGR